MVSGSRATCLKTKGQSSLMKEETITTFMIYIRIRFNLRMFQRTLLLAMMPSLFPRCNQEIKEGTMETDLWDLQSLEKPSVSMIPSKATSSDLNLMDKDSNGMACYRQSQISTSNEGFLRITRTTQQALLLVRVT